MTELGELRCEQGQYAEAAEAYRQAIALGPDAKLSYNLGYCLNRVAKRDEAIQQLSAARVAYPRNAEVANALGLQARRLSRAIAEDRDYVPFTTE